LSIQNCGAESANPPGGMTQVTPRGRSISAPSEFIAGVRIQGIQGIQGVSVVEVRCIELQQH
jgi:hypothetical protein